MANAIVIIILTFLTSLVVWTDLALYFYFFEKLPRIQFVSFHYLVAFASPAFFFFLFYKFLPHFNPFWTMVTTMISLFVIEFVAFTFFYKGELWFLNFVDWMVPAFIIATTVYFMGVVVK